MATEKLGYNFIYSGKSHYLKAAIEILEDHEIYNVFDSDEYYHERDKLNNNPVIFVRKGPTADFGVSSLFAFTIVIFIGKWAGGKALDELYSALKPSVVDFYKNLFQNVESGSNSNVEFQSVAHYDEQDVVVLIRMQIQSAQELDDKFNIIKSAHGQAIEFLTRNGKLAPVHEYSIENGKVNIEPNLFQSLDHIQSNERANSIKRMTNFVK